MRILMTTDAVGGVWTYSLELARSLAPHNVEVVLACLGPPPDAEKRAAAEAIPGLRLEHAPFALEWMEEPWDEVAAAGAWLLDLERAHAPDAVHLNGYVHAALPWRAPAMVVAHSCLLSWWAAVKGGPPPAAWSRYAAEVARGLRVARLVAAPTRAMLNALRRHHGPWSAPSLVVPNARDPAAFAPLPKRREVLAVGRFWDEAKDLATLDAAAEGLPAPVRVVGPAHGPDGAAAPQPRHLQLLGPLPEASLVEALGRAQVFASTARYEPFGLAPLEAALSGCALVLSDIASLREVWGDAATYAAPGDADGFHHALQGLLADARLARQAGQRARARALTYHPEAMAGSYLHAYRTLLAEPVAPLAPGGASA